MTGRSPFDRGEGNFESIRDEEADFAPIKKSGRRGCCCLPLWACMVLTLALVGGIASTVFFLWPRIPTVGYKGSKIDQASKAFGFKDQILTAHIKTDLELDNPNFINLYVKNVTLIYSIPVKNSNSVEVGQGYLLDGVDFPSKTSKNFTIESNLKFDLQTSNQDNVEAMDTVRKACEGSTKIKFEYYAKTDVPLISWTGYQPSFTGVFEIPCPFE